VFHGTDAKGLAGILKAKAFKPGDSSHLNLGPGVYVSRDLTICKMFGTKILKCQLSPGVVVEVDGWHNKWQWKKNQGEPDGKTKGHTAYLDQQKSKRVPKCEEWCVGKEAIEQGRAAFFDIEEYVTGA
jgi:hypothetical protein